MEAAAALALAISVDLLFGEPPTRYHPVGWIGRLVAGLRALAPRTSPAAQLLYGFLMVVLSVALATAASFLLLRAASNWNSWVYLFSSSLVLKSTFAIRELHSAAGRVRVRLQEGELLAARLELRSLVSRDATSLSSGQVAAAAVESVAENTVDSFVAPVFFFLLFSPLGIWGPVAALAYRVVNTLDAMIGYHGRDEYVGKVAARLDDLLNLIPARVGTLVFLSAAIALADGRQALRVLCRDRGRTESPNAGWMMSAAAGALGVRLEKTGHYCLGDGKMPEPATIDRICHLALVTSLLFAGLAMSIVLLRQGG